MDKISLTGMAVLCILKVCHSLKVQLSNQLNRGLLKRYTSAKMAVGSGWGFVTRQGMPVCKRVVGVYQYYMSTDGRMSIIYNQCQKVLLSIIYVEIAGVSILTILSQLLMVKIYVGAEQGIFMERAEGGMN